MALLTVPDAIQELTEAGIKKRTNHVSRLFRSAVRPLWGVSQSGAPEHIGSATLIEFNKRKVLVTAAHVIDQHRSSPLHIAGSSKLVSLAGSSFIATTAPNNNRNEDIFDFAFTELKAVDIKALGDVKFIQETEFLPEKSTPSGLYAVALGYPNSKNKYVNFRALKLPSRRWRYMARIEPDNPKIHGLNCPVESHLSLKFMKRSRNENGQIGLTTCPIGMSGGALFTVGAMKLDGLSSEDSFQIRCAGINILHVKNDQRIVAVRMNQIQTALVEQFG